MKNVRRSLMTMLASTALIAAGVAVPVSASAAEFYRTGSKACASTHQVAAQVSGWEFVYAKAGSRTQSDSSADPWKWLSAIARSGTSSADWVLSSDAVDTWSVTCSLKPV